MTCAAGFNERETELRRFAAWAAARRCWRAPRGGYLLLADFAPKQLARLKRAEKAPRLLEALQYGFETCYTLYRVSPSRPASGGGLNFELRRQESRFALKWGGRSATPAYSVRARISLRAGPGITGTGHGPKT